MQVARLLYTNSGVGLLALGSNATQKLWKWSRNEQNPGGKVGSHKVLLIIVINNVLVSCVKYLL